MAYIVNKPHFWISHIHTDSHHYALVFVLLIWHGFWKYLVCFAGSFGLYFSNEKLQKLPHFWSRILIFLIRLQIAKTMTKATQMAADESSSVPTYRHLLLFVWFISTQNIVRAQNALEKAVVMKYIRKPVLTLFYFFHRFQKFQVRWV